MRKSSYRVAAAIGLLLATATQAATQTPVTQNLATQTLALRPGTAQVAFRAYGLGFVPINGAFTRFNGTLAIGSANPAACQISIEAEAASLQMPDAAMTRDALGADLLDVAHYPVFAFHGECRDGQVRGTLLLHGVSRPLTLEASLEGGDWIATGRMHRADWGMGARPLLGGPEARVRFTVALPPGFPAKS